MKILFITAEGFDTPNPNNQMAEKIINAFLDQGHFVHLIQSHRRGVNEDVPRSLKGRARFSCDTVRRNVVDKSNFIRRYLNDSHYALQAMRYWKKVKDADVIYLQSNPTIIFPMLLLKLFKRLPIAYSIYDVFPGSAYAIGVIKSRLIYNTFRLMQMPCYRLADAIIVLSEDMKQKVVEQGASEDRIHVVPAWYDTSTTHEVPWEENRFVRKYGLTPGRFYVQFAGTIGYIFNYKAVLELAKRLLDTPEISIQIIGDGAVKEQFVAEAKAMGLSNIEFFPLQPVELVPDVYSTCDICIIPLKKGVIGNGVPSKAPILMACNRVIVNSVEIDSRYAQMFEENDMGLSVDNSDYDGFAAAVRQLYQSPGRLREMAQNANRFGKENYSSERSLAVLTATLESISNKGKETDNDHCI